MFNESIIITSRDVSNEIDKAELANVTVTKIEVIVLTSLFILTIAGNLIVILILLLYRTHPSRTVSRMSFYIIHLSIADFCVAIMSILPQIIWRSSVLFSDFKILCKMVTFSQVYIINYHFTKYSIIFFKKSLIISF